MASNQASATVGRRVSRLGAVVGLALSTTAICGLAAAAEPRAVMPLGEGWRFHLVPEGTSDPTVARAEQPDFVDADWSRISVPHTWNRAGYYQTTRPAHINTKENVDLTKGVGWYRLSFTPPATVGGQANYLQFDAASRVAQVWLNGSPVGVHKGGFSRFRFDVSSLLKPGVANELVVRVDNSTPKPGNDTADTLPLAGDFFVHGGLYRGVSLVSVGRQHFDLKDFGGPGVYVASRSITPQLAVASITARLANDAAKPASVRVKVRIEDANGIVVAQSQRSVALKAGETVPSTFELNVARPHLWQGVEDPYLYSVVAEVVGPKGIVDRVTQPYGIRDIRIDPNDGFFLNGRHVQLHGVSRHQDTEGKGWALSADDETRDVSLIRELGANTIRLAHYQQSEHMNALADQQGLVLWDEIPLVSKWTLGDGVMTPTDGLRENARQQLSELIRQNYNHPAVAVWSIANEVDFGMPVGVDFSRTSGEGPDPRPLLNELNGLAHSLDPSRPSTLATCCESRSELPGAKPPVVAGITDVFGANRYFGWYYGRAAESAPYMDRNHHEHPNSPMSVSEYGAGGAISQQTDNAAGGPASSRGRIQPEGYQSAVLERSWSDFNKRPYLWATWVWNMFDFATTIRREGDAMDINTKGLVTYDRQVKKDGFYFYKANWSHDPVVYIAGRRYVDRAYSVTDVKVYSNAPTTELSLNGRSLGTRSHCENAVCVWPNVQLAQGDNHLVATAERDGKKLVDEVSWTVSQTAASRFLIDCGALMGTTNGHGRYGSDAFFVGGEAGSVNPSAPFGLPSSEHKAIAGTDMETVLESYRKGHFAYVVPIANGKHTVRVRFVEPVATKAGERIFDVVANGKVMVSQLDLFVAAGGALKATDKTFEVEVRNGELRLDFNPAVGDAIASAIEIDG